MHLSILTPARDIAHLVRFYCLCEDREGAHAGQPIVTAPQLGACLCIQLGDPVLTDFSDARPLMSVAGVQGRLQRYVPEGAVRALVIFLTLEGSLRVTRHHGRQLFSDGVDFAAMIGDGPVLALRRVASAAPDDTAMAKAVDVWMRDFFDRTPERAEDRRLTFAAETLRARRQPISRLAEAVDLSERQLEREFRAHLGISPKGYAVLDRVTRSLHATFTGRGDPLDGFADQAHQIRAWKAILGMTPGEFRKNGPSGLGRLYRERAEPVVSDWAHYL